MNNMKRVNFLCLMVLGLFFASCHSNDDTWGDWSLATQFPGRPRTAAVTFTSEDGKNVFIGLGKNYTLVTEKDKSLKDLYRYDGTTWTRVDSFPDLGRYGAVAFVIGKYAYVGTGYRDGIGGTDYDVYYKDFYVFDIAQAKWVKNAAGDPVKIPDFPGDGRKYGVAFAIDGKGYVGTGMMDGGDALTDFYAFTPSADGLSGTWEEIANYPDRTAGAVAFVLDGKAVVCLGAGSSSATDYKKGVYVWDPKNTEKRWIAKEVLADVKSDGFDDDYAKIPRAYAVAFVAEENGVKKGYIATGAGPSPKTCWEYDIRTDRWDEVTEMPANMSSRSYCVAYSYNGYGFVTTGGTGLDSPLEPTTWKFTPGIDEDEDNDWAPNS